MSVSSIARIRVSTEVVLGRRELSVEELARIKEGTVVELNSIAGEPVDLVAAGRVIAKGEVVIVDESFGIRVTELLREESRDG